MITLKLKIGKGQVEFQAENMKSIHEFSSIYGALPDRCDNCKSENIHLSFRDTKEGFKYYGIECKDCSASLNLGQKKEGGFFLKFGEKMKVYSKNQDASQADQGYEQNNRPDSDPPF